MSKRGSRKRAKRATVSLLHLDRWIPITDLRKHFYRKYLNLNDLVMIKCAHGIHCLFSVHNLIYYTKSGYLDVLKYTRGKWLHIPFDTTDEGVGHSLLNCAIGLGHLNVAKWLYSILQGMSSGQRDWNLQCAARTSQILALEWLASLGVLTAVALMGVRHEAIEHEQIAVLEWLFVKQPELPRFILPYTAGAGKLVILQWLLDNGIFGEAKLACRRAREESHFEAVAVLKEYGLVE